MSSFIGTNSSWTGTNSSLVDVSPGALHIGETTSSWAGLSSDPSIKVECLLLGRSLQRGGTNSSWAGLNSGSLHVGGTNSYWAGLSSSWAGLSSGSLHTGGTNSSWAGLSSGPLHIGQVCRGTVGAALDSNGLEMLSALWALHIGGTNIRALRDIQCWLRQHAQSLAGTLVWVNT